jgi:hypothetical protein
MLELNLPVRPAGVANLSAAAQVSEPVPATARRG